MSTSAALTYETAERRWAGVGPYYAMFPTSFADRVICRHTKRGQTVLDPFSGRGTTLFSAAINGRIGIGVEVNPVGWVYAKAKLHPANKTDVLARLEQVAALAPRFRDAAEDLPVFFTYCFAPRVREFLLSARSLLTWRRNAADWTTMALLLVYLHGKRDAALSNQMRQTKSMAPNYAVEWWRKNNLKPLRIDALEFMQQRVEWRYAKGIPAGGASNVYLGDSRNRLSRFKSPQCAKASLLLTSPPYCGVTNYHYDQWLRLWLLGGAAAPERARSFNCGRFVDQQRYRQLLLSVFERASTLLKRNAVIYVRTDGRSTTYDATKAVIKSVFPRKRLTAVAQPYRTATQTELFGSPASDSGEIDLILQPA